MSILPKLPGDVKHGILRISVTFSLRLSEALNAIQPLLNLHAGGLELVSADEATGQVKIRFLGHCAGCGLSNITLKEGIERLVCARVPEVREIVAVL